ncbi:MAG: hypothetical protein KatS3mg039_1656 [Candidatus Kapaibacterium sp.]|nr:MAG: hypothetical protein KatS3mg039_1656 [Candidatus Kapabacteria bacterium]
MMGQRHVVVVSCGTTPQIVTLTLWALKAQRHIDWSECYIVTTPTGRALLDDHLFLQQWYRLGQSLCLSSMPPLSDELILTISDELNWAEFGNVCLSLLIKLTSDPSTVLHVSVSGGQPMSALLGLSMAWVGRPQDRLYHVLAQHDFSAGGAFFPDHASSNAVVVSEIPFIRLRAYVGSYLQQRLPSYQDWALSTQALPEAVSEPQHILLDIGNKQLTVDGIPISLSILECAVYWWIVTAPQPIPWGKQLPLSEWQRFLELYRWTMSLHPRHSKVAYTMRTPFYAQLELLQKVVSTIKRKVRAVLLSPIAEWCSPCTAGSYAQKTLQIKAAGKVCITPAWLAAQP